MGKQNIYWLVVGSCFISIYYEIILAIDELIFFKMVIAPPTRLLLAIIHHIMTIYEPLLTVY
jgi:hypothetical protein